MTTTTVPTPPTSSGDGSTSERILARVGHWPDEYLAARLHRTPAEVDALRSGRICLTVPDLGRIAQALGVSASQLFREVTA